jgi:hypothetical protein
MFRIPVLLILLFSLALGLSAQSSGGGGKKTSTPASIPPNPGNVPSLPRSDTTPRSFFLSGKVMVDDGTLLTDSAIIQSICEGRTRTEGYTDSKGRFSFEINSLKESGALGGNAQAQAMDSSRARGKNSIRRTGVLNMEGTSKLSGIVRRTASSPSDFAFRCGRQFFAINCTKYFIEH